MEDHVEIGAWVFCQSTVTHEPGTMTLSRVTNQLTFTVPLGTPPDRVASIDAVLVAWFYTHKHEGEPVITVTWEQPDGTFHELGQTSIYFAPGLLSACRELPLTKIPLMPGVHRFRLMLDGVVRATTPVQVTYVLPQEPSS